MASSGSVSFTYDVTVPAGTGASGQVQFVYDVTVPAGPTPAFAGSVDFTYNVTETAVVAGLLRYIGGRVVRPALYRYFGGQVLDESRPSNAAPPTTVPAPVAALTGTPTSGTPPLAVQFTDTSTNAPTVWAWTFGDGATSAAQNPSHTYASAGTYTVVLTASNAGGSNTQSRANYVVVTAPPTAATPALLSRVVGVDGGVKVQTTNATSVRLMASTDASGTAGVVFSSVATPDGNGVAYPKFAAGVLGAGTRYYYRVAMKDTNGVEILDTDATVGRIRVAPIGPTSFAFNFASCCNATDSASMAAIAARGDDLFFHLGDLWYADASGVNLSNYLTQMGNKVGVANHKAVFTTTPSAFGPSDHDASMNNNGNAGTDATATGFYNQAYRRYLPTPTGMPATTGIYYPFQWGRVLFLNLDCRSFASNPANTDNSSKTMLGATQKQWLKDQITASTAAVICLIGDTAWTGAAAAGDDAWIGFTTERAELAAFFTASGKNVCYLSGDMHAVGADDGSAPNNPGSLVTFAAAPLNNNSSQKVSGWSAGIYPSSGTSVVQQYGRIAVTDTGSAVTFAYTGYSSDNTARITLSKTWTTAATTTGPIGPSGTWTRVFNDDFDGTSVDSNKWATNWFGGNVLNGTPENPANISFPGDSTVTMQVNNNSVDGSGAAAGCILTSNPSNGGGIGAGFQPQVGDYAEARIYFSGSGSSIFGWPAWWTDGPSWPGDGEIDIFEGLGTATSNYHSPAGANNSGTIPGTWSNAFHTYGAHRKSGSVDIYWDGRLVRSYTTSDSGAKHFMILTNGPGGGSARGSASNMKVDWVRVWRPA